MKKVLLLLLLSSCSASEDYSLRRDCLFNNYGKFPKCQNYNFVAAKKNDKKINEVEKKNSMLKINYSTSGQEFYSLEKTDQLEF
jgi:hypothetical protein